MEEILEKIREKEQELWIENSYYWRPNEMFEWLHSQWYANKEVYKEVIDRNLIRKNQMKALSVMEVMRTMWAIKSTDIATILSPDTYVYRWSHKEYCNEEYCKQHNIPIVDLWHEWGTIVVSPWAYSFWFIGIPEIEWDYIIDKVAEYLWANKEWNDLIIEWYKVCGMSNYRPYKIVHLSYNVDMDLIEHICNKKMEKVPKWITELTGKTWEDLDAWLKTWLIKWQNE